MLTTKTIAIIGAGIAGCATAHALAKRGFQVNIFEKNASIASEASGNPSGLLYPRLSGDAHASAFALAAYIHSLAFYRALYLPQNALHFSGLLQLGFNARERARIQKVASWISPDIARIVDANVSTQLSGIECQHEALFFPQAAWLQPKAICEALTQHKNISVFTLNNINNIMNNNGLLDIYSDNNLIEKADIVVVANAHKAQYLASCAHLETIKIRGQLTQLGASECSQHLKMPICTDGYLIPENNSLHTLGATFSFESHTEVTDADHQENLNKLQSMSENLYQSLRLQVQGGRTAFRCASPDHLPLVGQLLDANVLQNQPPRPSAAKHTLPWMQNFYVNIGHGSHGFCSAPLAAEIIAAQIAQENLPIASQIAASLNPNRFLLKKLGLKKIAKMVACDWLEE